MSDGSHLGGERGKRFIANYYDLFIIEFRLNALHQLGNIEAITFEKHSLGNSDLKKITLVF